MSLDGVLRRETQLGAAVIVVVLLAGVWCAGALAHLALTLLLIRTGVRMWPAIYIQAAVAGSIGALLVAAVLALVLYRREVLRRQLLAVAELNHEVRNSLEVIASSTSRIADKQTVATILEAVTRIDVSLRSLFPITIRFKKDARPGNEPRNSR